MCQVEKSNQTNSRPESRDLQATLLRLKSLVLLLNSVPRDARNVEWAAQSIGVLLTLAGFLLSSLPQREQGIQSPLPLPETPVLSRSQFTMGLNAMRSIVDPLRTFLYFSKHSVLIMNDQTVETWDPHEVVVEVTNAGKIAFPD